jgi:beta-glucanase (GH16 family)
MLEPVRRTRLARLGLALAASVSSACSAPPQPEPEVFQEPIGGWVETWRDDFDGPMGSGPDPKKWHVDVRPMGQNKELDYDTDDRKNSFLDGSGNLVFQLIKENYVDAQGVTSTQPYTSARLDTRGTLEQTYGKFEARIKLPPGGKGIWPAFWLLGANIQDVGWPDCGEVDILEMRGSQPARILSSLHGPSYYGSDSYNSAFELPSGKLGDDFHTFTFEWTPDAVRWLLDGKEYFLKTASAVGKDGRKWVYDHPFYVILNLAVGGIFDGAPEPATVFPQQMLVDYVSVSTLPSP